MHNPEKFKFWTYWTTFMKCFTLYLISNHSLIFYLVNCWLFISLAWSNFKSVWAVVVWTSTGMSFLWSQEGEWWQLHGNAQKGLIFLLLSKTRSISVQCAVNCRVCQLISYCTVWFPYKMACCYHVEIAGLPLSVFQSQRITPGTRSALPQFVALFNISFS